jgi:SsrA-binding protein
MTNRRARHDYFIEQEFEAGVVLVGTEVKSLRAGKVNLQDAYCVIENGEVWLTGAHISPYSHGGNYFNHVAVRNRKLLLSKREIRKMLRATEQKGYTLVPLSLYLKNKKVKVLVGVARGKKLYDKRDSMAERDSKRELDRVRKSGTTED